jgi:hypothetical protein
MLADLVSSLVLTGTTFIYRLSRVLSGPRSVYIYLIICSAGVEVDVLPSRISPQTCMVFWWGFLDYVSELARSSCLRLIGPRRARVRITSGQLGHGPTLCPYFLLVVKSRGSMRDRAS